MNFVFDLDGTLCFNGKSIDKEIIDALQELKFAGHQVIFASARPFVIYYLLYLVASIKVY